MSQQRGKRSRTSKTATASTPQGELQRHLKDLGLEDAETYRPEILKRWAEQERLIIASYV